MSTKKRVTMCLTIRLRDYSAFEDLAEELGVEVFDVRLMEPDSSEEAVTTPRRIHQKRRVFLTAQIWDKVMSYPETMTFSSMARQMGKGNRNSREVPSSQTISRIRRGIIKRPKTDAPPWFQDAPAPEVPDRDWNVGVFLKNPEGNKEEKH